jgi:hypothetical protein
VSVPFPDILNGRGDIDVFKEAFTYILYVVAGFRGNIDKTVLVYLDPGAFSVRKLCQALQNNQGLLLVFSIMQPHRFLAL